MGLIGDCNFRGFEELLNRLERQATPQQVDKLMQDIANEAGHKVLSQVIELTPVGVYSEAGRVGGHLKRNWFLSPAIRTGEYVEVTIYNNVFYASFVEYGHRQKVGQYVPAIGKRLVKPWVEGQFMLTKSIAQMEVNLESIIKKHTQRFLERLTRGG